MWAEKIRQTSEKNLDYAINEKNKASCEGQGCGSGGSWPGSDPRKKSDPTVKTNGSGSDRQEQSDPDPTLEFTLDVKSNIIDILVSYYNIGQ